jgi:CRP/FNR family transcriptional regulator
VLFKFCRAGDLIDGVLLCGIEVHNTYAKALEDTGVCFIPKANFEELLHEYPQVSLEVIRRLDKDLAMLKKRLTDMAYKDVRERLIGLLLDLGEIRG